MGEFSISSYDGKSDPTTWLTKAEKLLKAKKFEPETWHLIASFKLKGKAYNWFESVESTIKSWEQFVGALKSRFSSRSSKGGLLRKLTSLEQKKNESLRSYNDRFNIILARYNNAKNENLMDDDKLVTTSFIKENSGIINDVQSLQLYISSLTKFARRHVQYSKPKTLKDAQDTAKDLDDSDTETSENIDDENKFIDSDDELSTSKSDISDTESDNDTMHKLNTKKMNKIMKDIKIYHKKNNKIQKKTSKKTADPNAEIKSGIESLTSSINDLKIYLVSKEKKGHTQNNNAISCFNCRGENHLAKDCHEKCKICKGEKGDHPYYQCPNYKPRENTAQNSTPSTAMLCSQPVEEVYSTKRPIEDETTDKRRIRIKDILNQPDNIIEKLSSTTANPKSKKKKLKCLFN